VVVQQNLYISNTYPHEEEVEEESPFHIYLYNDVATTKKKFPIDGIRIRPRLGVGFGTGTNAAVE
jgi:hypothetical protein